LPSRFAHSIKAGLRNDLTRLRFERRQARLIGAALATQLRRALRGPRTDVEAVVQRLAEQGAPVRAALRTLLEEAARAGVTDRAARLAAPVKAAPVTDRIQLDIDWTQANEAVLDWIHGGAPTSPGRGGEPLVGQHPAGWLNELYNTTLATSQTTVRKAMMRWMESGQPLSKLTEQLTPQFGPVRGRAIAVTETTRAYVEGNLATWQATGLVQYPPSVKPPAHVHCRCDVDIILSDDGRWIWTWLTARSEDVCPICRGLAQTVHNPASDEQVVAPGTVPAAYTQHFERGLALPGPQIVTAVEPIPLSVPQFETALEAQKWAMDNYTNVLDMPGLKSKQVNAINRGIASVIKEHGVMVDSVAYAKTGARFYGSAQLYSSGDVHIGLQKSFVRDAAKRVSEEQSGFETQHKAALEKVKRDLADPVRFRLIEYNQRKLVNLEATARWSSIGEANDPLATAAAHEAGHALYFKKPEMLKPWLDGLDKYVTIPDRFAVSEYAATSESELFAEVTALIFDGRRSVVPDSILRAYDEALKAVK
jgi:hypothetical protein